MTSVIVALAILSAVAASIGWGISVADESDLTGRPVPDDQMTAIVTAARSCPMLTPARLAGQLMVESGLNSSATGTVSGGRGIAGLDDGDWEKWAPWPRARRADTSANIFALAHQVCDFSGQVRLAEVPGEQWRLSLAAFRSGLEAVRTAGGVPESAIEYVDKAGRYANYYAKLPQFGDPRAAQLAPTGSPASVKPLPDTYVQPVVAAGKVCRQLSPAAAAAVLMAASQLNPNLLGPDGEQGIAQFRADLWQRYGPRNASAWDPAAAIPAMGAALCGMLKELSGLEGDPYLLALAAFRTGPDAVRQTGGTPDAATQTFLRDVASYTSYYALDTRLTTKPVAPPAAVPPRAPTSAPSAPPQAVQGTKPTAPDKKPAPRDNQPPVKAKGAQHSYGPYFIHNSATDLCADLPGFERARLDGPVNQYRCAKTGTDNQEFEFVPRRVDGEGYQLYWIRNIDNQYCFDPPGRGSVPSGATVSVTNCIDPNDNQLFRLEPTLTSRGFQYYWLRNAASGLCLDVPGNSVTREVRLELSICRHPDDQDWALVEKAEW
ncbi:RICIN domain-containing protein [Plantactinospora sp. WMMB334]|uniref:RICIN domain-containing protein n=1 Tax=Plantactinospora sp. WMMB334 TaxID=3404119 RepID=UPI003B95A862